MCRFSHLNILVLALLLSAPAFASDNGVENAAFELECFQNQRITGLLPVPALPSWQLDSVQGREDELLEIAANLDFGEAYSLNILLEPEHGEVQLDKSANRILFSPEKDWFGEDVLEYEFCTEAGCQVSRVVLQFASVNDWPILQDVSEFTWEDRLVIVDVLANDHDPDGWLETATVSLLDGPHSGSASADPITGEFIYQPDQDFFGLDSFRYSVSDNEGASHSALVILQVKDVNDPPRLQGEADFTMVGQSIIIDVLANDLDVDGHLNPGTVMLLDEPRLGQADPDPITGELVYEAFRSGTERFRYRICDDDGDCEEALLVVDVAPNPDQEEEELAEEEIIAAVDTEFEEDFLDQWIEEELYEIPTPVTRQIEVNSGLEAHLGFEAPEGFELEVLLSPSQGLAWMNKGQIVYRSIPQFEGEDLLRYVWVDAGGRRSEPAEVRIKVKAIPIDVPEAFTPNGDGINDIFRIGGLTDWPNCEVRIYDRSQRLVKVMRGPDDSWDGTMRGKDLVGDTYFLVVDYDRRDKNSPQYRGFTTIVR